MISIRAAHADDAFMMAEARIAAWRTAYPGVVPDDYLTNMSAEVDQVRMRERLLQDDGALAVVAEDAGQVIGYALAVWPCQADPTFGAELIQIYVQPAYQSQGIGRQLMSAAADQLRAREIHSVMLEVFTANQPARAFYERLGGERLWEAPYHGFAWPIDVVAYGWREISQLEQHERSR